MLRVAFVMIFAPLCCSMAIYADDQINDLYRNEVKPVLRSNCVSCHGPLKQEGGLRLDAGALIRAGGDSGEVIDLEDPGDSLLVERISSHDDDERMPPESEPLTAGQIERITAWIASGAVSPATEIALSNPKEHWSFQPIADAAEPESNLRNPIDAFVNARLKENGISSSAPADPSVLVRRLFLDLHGLPPSPEQMRTWTHRIQVSDDQQSTINRAAVAELVDELLDSPRYGERWAQHWLDIVRYADTHGFEVNTPRDNAWHYRDYVIAAFNDDKPYDQFVFEQLAGDTVGADTATGFLVAAAVLLPGQIGKDAPSIRLARQDSLDEMIVGTSATFLGLTIGCARCHDHKFDPVSQEDYYAFQAFFAGVEYGDRPITQNDDAAAKAESEDLGRQIETLTAELRQHEPIALNSRTILIDDEDLNSVTLLKQKNGHGSNPDGTGRGYKQDPGSAERHANLSAGRYTWWDNHPGEDVFTWNPKSAGNFRIWISWGVHGSGVHTRDARYVLDLDGNLETKNDQTEIATADQYYFAGVDAGESEQKPLWSGFFDAGIHGLNENSKLVLRGGESGTGITADVIVLQESVGADQTDSAIPKLRDPVNFSHNIERFVPTKARFVRFTSLATVSDNKHQPCIDELEIFQAGDQPTNLARGENVALSSSGNYSETGIHQIKHINDGKYGNSHSWISNEYGKGWIELDLAKEYEIDRIEWGRDRLGKFKDRLAIDYKIEVSLDGESWTRVAGSSDRMPMETPVDRLYTFLRNSVGEENVNLRETAARLESLKEKKAKLDQPMLAYAGIFREPDQTMLLNRGDAEQPLKEVAPQVPRILGKLNTADLETDQQRRTELARWIIDKSNPLTARVIANRVWQYHFGRGLVETPSDFGLSGVAPSHSELLDWLAGKLIENNWSIKSLHRLILDSETYQQSSAINANAQSIDGDCRLYWRFPSRRLEAESIRDSILSVSGQLNLKMGGPGFNFFKSRGGLSGFPPVDKFGEEEKRRMIYAHKIRMEPVPVFGAFDCPDAGQAMPQRSQSTTAIQALNLFNSQFVFDQSQQLAKVIEAESSSTAERVNAAFVRTLCREPTAKEATALCEFVDKHGTVALCRVLFNSNEFLFIP